MATESLQRCLPGRPGCFGARRGRVLNPPMDIPKVGRFCVLQDPTGAVISAMQYLEG